MIILKEFSPNDLTLSFSVRETDKNRIDHLAAVIMKNGWIDSNPIVYISDNKSNNDNNTDCNNNNNNNSQSASKSKNKNTDKSGSKSTDNIIKKNRKIIVDDGNHRVYVLQKLMKISERFKGIRIKCKVIDALDATAAKIVGHCFIIIYFN